YLLGKAQNGLYITELSGLHSGANGISGDFSLSAEGYIIHDGKLGFTVDRITIAGNFYELLKNIQLVGDDLEFLTNGLGSPSIYIDSLDISGEF
ncbi:MAG: TldD/PmbA family protein, partial [Firmicutes bacterium]|nr:TldD/PmbA family protein [Bacillota bacterium]